MKLRGGIGQRIFLSPDGSLPILHRETQDASGTGPVPPSPSLCKSFDIALAD